MDGLFVPPPPNDDGSLMSEEGSSPPPVSSTVSPPVSPRHDLYGAPTFPGEWCAGEPWRPLVPPVDDSPDALAVYLTSMESNICDWAQRMETRLRELNLSMVGLIGAIDMVRLALLKQDSETPPGFQPKEDLVAASQGEKPYNPWEPEIKPNEDKDHGWGTNCTRTW